MTQKTTNVPNQEIQIPNQETQEPKSVKKEKSVDQDKNPVDQGQYDKYTSLKFFELSGTKLKDEVKEEIEELEKEIKSCSGKVPIITVRAAIANEQVLLVEGIPVPESIEKLIKEKEVGDYYFGK